MTRVELEIAPHIHILTNTPSHSNIGKHFATAKKMLNTIFFLNLVGAAAFSTFQKFGRFELHFQEEEEEEKTTIIFWSSNYLINYHHE
jgi:hypothetical protein